MFRGKECPDEVKVLVLGPFYMTRRLPDRREGTAAIVRNSRVGSKLMNSAL